ncbi:MAG: hypothetical protein ACFHX7_16305 [Pseudomonadota bacterium]
MMPELRRYSSFLLILLLAWPVVGSAQSADVRIKFENVTVVEGPPPVKIKCPVLIEPRSSNKTRYCRPRGSRFDLSTACVPLATTRVDFSGSEEFVITTAKAGLLSCRPGIPAKSQACTLLQRTGDIKFTVETPTGCELDPRIIITDESLLVSP